MWVFFRLILIFSDWYLVFAAHVLHSNNEHYIRLQSLKELTQGDYRQDVITGNLSGYILEGV